MENDEKCLSLNAGGSQSPVPAVATSCESQLSYNLKLSRTRRERDREKEREKESPLLSRLVTRGETEEAENPCGGSV